MKKWLVMFIIVIAAGISCLCVHNLYAMRKKKSVEEFSRLVFLPDSLVKTVSLEFKGFVADYLFLKLMVLHGEHLVERREFSEKEWRTSYKALQQITMLDPPFLDPYVFAETTFPWEGGMVAETNELLQRAVESRPNDYQPNYFIWFNYYYFLNDAKKSAPYLEKASQLPGAPAYLKTLAARMRLYSGELQSGILFLQEMIRETNSEREKYWMQQRLLGLQALELLESAVREYKKKYNRPPADINELVTGRILKKIPPDPYGGEFYLMENDRVYTTSKLVGHKQEKAENVHEKD